MKTDDAFSNENDMNADLKPELVVAATASPSSVRINSRELFGCGNEVVIVHKGEEYRPRITRNEKLHPHQINNPTRQPAFQASQKPLQLYLEAYEQETAGCADDFPGVFRPGAESINEVHVATNEHGAKAHTDISRGTADSSFGVRVNVAWEKLRSYVEGADGDRGFLSLAPSPTKQPCPTASKRALGCSAQGPRSQVSCNYRSDEDATEIREPV